VRRALVYIATAAISIGCGFAPAVVNANTPLAPEATLSVDRSRPGNAFEPGAVGLSIEARELSTGHLNAGHYRLVRLMRLLGPSLLRIGGNTVDLSWWTSRGEPPPTWATSIVTPADLGVLRALLIATHWRVLLGVNLGHFEPSRVADEARVAKQILGASLAGIEIGNEPDDFSGAKQDLRSSKYGIGEYLREATSYGQALSAATPGLALYGPALSETRWLMRLGTSLGLYSGLTQHYYPTGGCPDSPPPSASIPAPTATGLLSPPVRYREDEVLGLVAQVARNVARTPFIGETNVVACGGSPNVGPQFASALWALDWSLRAGSRGMKGLSFHGQLGPCGSFSESPVCASNAEAARAGDIQVQPEYYGLLAARQLEGGRFVPTSLIAPGALPNLTTWATLARGATMRIAIDDLATSGPAQPVRISVPGYSATSEEMLSGPSVEARRGIALGSASVTHGAEWQPRSGNRQRGHAFRVVVRPASAVIIRLHRTARG
jgi:hypothetical protein